MSMNLTRGVNSTKNYTKFNQIPITAMDLFNVFLITILILFTIWYLQFWYARKRLYKYFAKIPKNMFHLPFIGIGHRFGGHSEDSFKIFMDLSKNETPAGAWLGYEPLVFINKPEDMKIVLNSPKSMSKSRFYKFLEIGLGDGLLTAPVPIWKIHRKLMRPTFRQNVINSFVGLFTKHSEILIELLKPDVGKPVDLTQKLNSCSLDTVYETALGLNIGSQIDDSVFVHSLHRIMGTITTRIMNIFYHNDFLYNILSKDAKQAKTDKIFVMDFIDKILKQKYKSFKEICADNIDRPEAEITDEKPITPFLDLFMTLNVENKTLSDEKLKYETTNILIAGSETSATAIGFVSLMLGMYPQVQEKLFEEIFDVIGYDRPVVLSDLLEFKYMERVIKETMRLFPIGAFIFRHVDEDLQMNNYLMPKGCSIAVAIIALHRSPDIWPDPLKFDPDRFLPEEVAKRHPYSYLPFLAGPRNCIGMKYAMMSMKTILTYIVRTYHIQTHYKDITEIRLKQDIVLKAVEGFPVILTERRTD